jgi:hypothetical protein
LIQHYIFRNIVDFKFSECIKLFGLIRSITFRFSFLDCLYMLYFTLVISKLEYASVVWNSITSTNASKFERMRQKFTSVCFCRLIPHVVFERLSYDLIFFKYLQFLITMHNVTRCSMECFATLHRVVVTLLPYSNSSAPSSFMGFISLVETGLI